MKLQSIIEKLIELEVIPKQWIVEMIRCFPVYYESDIKEPDRYLGAYMRNGGPVEIHRQHFFIFIDSTDIIVYKGSAGGVIGIHDTFNSIELLFRDK